MVARAPEPGYREHVGERFGRYQGTAPQAVLWVHAVSLGETRAAVPLIARLQRAHPDATVLLTHMTATGRAAGRELFGDGVVQAWLPYDVPFAVRAFLRHFRPCAGMLVETELWPNLVALCAAAGVPLYLVNARLSERSAARYAHAGALARPMLAALSGIAAQTATHAARFAALGAAAPVATGNLKFDLQVPDTALALGRELRQAFGASRPVWVAASTRDGEEALILDAIDAQALPAHTLTVVVPRHPQRFDAVAALLRERGIPFVRRSANAGVPADVRVVLGDSMGELLGYFAAADVAFVGGSLLPLGGQNLIEPIAVRAADAGRPAHVQFRRGDRERAGGRRRAPRRRRRRTGRAGGGPARRPGAARRDERRRAGIPRRPSRRRRPAVAMARAAAGGGARRRPRGAARRATRRQPLSRRLISSTSASVSEPTADFSRSTPMM